MSANDLIHSKTKEFEQIPALLLGLDGWILRSIPDDLRRQFLSGYEKLLKVVFHPDRYVDGSVKKSREIFLQAVGEAVRYMLADEFAFQMMTDSVPSKKNPIVTLRDQISARDGIIARLNSEIGEGSRITNEAQAEAGRLRATISNMQESFAQSENRWFLLKNAMAEITRKFPVPIRFKRYSVTGKFVKPDALLCDGIDDFLNGRRLDVQNQLTIAAHRQKSQTQTFNVSNGATKSFSVIGAMTASHLVEFVRSSGLLSYAAIDKRLLREISGMESDESDYRMSVAPFLIPFFSDGTILLVKTGKYPSRHSLFLVTACDAADNQFEALVSGLQRDSNKAQTENHKLRKDVSELKKTVKCMEREIKDLESDLEKSVKKPAKKAGGKI